MNRSGLCKPTKSEGKGWGGRRSLSLGRGILNPRVINVCYCIVKRISSLEWKSVEFHRSIIAHGMR